MPFNLGFGEIFLILVLVLLLFGAKRIPEIAQSMGKGIREFKSSLSDVDKDIRGAGDRDRAVRSERSERLDAGERPAAAPRTDDDQQDRQPKRLLG
jgi:sec-independent protein translocase protein TatA